MNCLTATYSIKEHTLIDEKLYYRKLTPVECERLQTLPDGYTEGVSNTQRYKMLGNGWTAEVIAHLFRSLPMPKVSERGLGLLGLSTFSGESRREALLG